MNITNQNKVNQAFKKSLGYICDYAAKNPDIKRLVVFGNALDLENPADRDDEMHVAVYLNDPTPAKIETIARYINDNIDLVWACMIDDEKYNDSPILKQTISKGVTVYGE